MSEPPAACRLIELPKIPDARGNLSFIESGNHIPFEVRRTYWIYDVPGGQTRGGHAYRTLHEFFVALSGSFDVVVDSGRGEPEHVVLNRSYVGLHVPPLTWRHLENFSTNAVCLILASEHHADEDYLRDRDEFLALTGSPPR